MAKLHATARMVQGPLIVLENGRAHATVVDQPSTSSPGVGPTPLELCVMSHAGCYVTIAQRGDLRHHLQNRPTEDQVKRLHEHTLKNCPVGVLFEKAGVKVTYTIKTQKE